MLYFALPNFYEHYFLNSFMCEMNKVHPEFFKTKISFYCSQGALPYHSWNGGINSNFGTGAYYQDFISLQNKAQVPYRINCANVLLEDYDFYDNLSQIALECLNNGSVVLEISSIPLMEKLQEKYPYYRYMFSKQADLITAFTPEMIDSIIETDQFTMVGIPDKYTFNKEWLRQIQKKSKCEITVNPLCSARCKNHDACLLKEHQNQIDYSNQQQRLTCSNKNNIFDANSILTIEKLKDYTKLGFNHFTFSNVYNVNVDEVAGFYFNYFIKPEHILDMIGLWSQRVQQISQVSSEQGGM